MPVDEEWELAGKVAGGRYLVVSTLEKGSRSDVYEADHVASGKRVALKVLRTHPAIDAIEPRRSGFEPT